MCRAFLGVARRGGTLGCLVNILVEDVGIAAGVCLENPAGEIVDNPIGKRSGQFGSALQLEIHAFHEKNAHGYAVQLPRSVELVLLPVHPFGRVEYLVAARDCMSFEC
jgi:hypothetical protein